MTGSLYPRSYVDRSGDTRFSLDVVADGVEFLTPKGRQEGAPQHGAPAGLPDADGFTELTADDIPF